MTSQHAASLHLQIVTKDLELARTMARDSEGWLLDLGDGHYLATNDEGTVRDLRGPAFVTQGQQTGKRDETLGDGDNSGTDLPTSSGAPGYYQKAACAV